MPWSWITSDEHWRWLSPPSLLLALLTWLGRRKRWRPFDALVRQGRLNEAIVACRQSLASCEESRANEEHGRRAAIVALEEMVKAGAMVRREVAQGRLTISDGSSTPPPGSRATSSGSRRPRKPAPPVRR